MDKSGAKCSHEEKTINGVLCFLLIFPLRVVESWYTAWVQFLEKENLPKPTKRADNLADFQKQFSFWAELYNKFYYVVSLKCVLLFCLHFSL